jgi:adenylate cyclase
MFVAVDPNAACEIALLLVDAVRELGRGVRPRGAVAFGPVLQRGGDYYGPTVNLAARVAELAVPYEILVTEGLVSSAEHWTLLFAPAGRRMLKGFDEPVTLWELARRA